MNRNRAWLVALYVVVSVLQAWDSEVAGAPGAVAVLVGAAILAPATAYVAFRDPRLHFGAVALSAVLVLVARFASPVRHGELFFIPWLAFMLLWFERMAETRRGEPRRQG